MKLLLLNFNIKKECKLTVIAVGVFNFNF
jgi:hypothetical protein